MESRHRSILVSLTDAELGKLDIWKRCCIYYIGHDGRFLVGFACAKTLSAANKVLGVHRSEGVSDVFKVVKEFQEEEDVIEWGSVPKRREAKGATNDVNIRESLAESTTAEEFMTAMEEKSPSYFIHSEKALYNYALKKFDNGNASNYSKDSFITPFITDWSRVPVIVGDTGLGKTEWALAHFDQPLHVLDKNDYCRYRKGFTDGIILDDVDSSKWTGLTFLKFLKMEVNTTQNIKYGHVVIEKKCKRMILTNDMDAVWPTDMLPKTREACLRRMNIIHIRDPTYKKAYTKNMIEMLTLAEKQNISE